MKTKPALVTPEELLRAYLREHSMRCTPERFSILARALEQKGAFTAGFMAGVLEQEGYHVSLPTVYATLRLLCEAGVLVREASAEGVTFRAAPPGKVSVLMVCSVCGKERRAAVPELQRVLAAKKFWGFTPSGFRLRVDGMCSRCRKLQAAAKTERNQTQ